MTDGVITRKRGVIPGCRVPGADDHMAVDGRGHSWQEAAKLTSTVDASLAELTKKSGSRKSRGGATHGRTN
jgi:hypothetical protein